MKKAFQGSFIYRLFFYIPLYQGGEKTFLEQSFVYGKCQRFYEKFKILAIQSVAAAVGHGIADYFSKYGLKTTAIGLLAGSFYALLFKKPGFTLFEFFFYPYLVILALFFLILGNHLMGYYETSRVKRYFDSGETPSR